MNLKTSVVNITPTLAKKYLQKNTSNRPISSTHVEFLFQQMSKGFWKFGPETISFGKNGKLLDGQHRLHALVKVNKSFDFLVVEGVDEKVFDVLNTGRNRSAGDVLAMDGYDNANALAGMVRFVLSYYNSSGSMKFRGKRNAPSNLEIRQYIKDNVALNNKFSTCDQYYREMGYLLPLSFLGGMFFVLTREVTLSKVEDFYNKLCSGIGAGKDCPTRLLRQRLLKDNVSAAKVSPRHKLALFIKTWNAFYTNSVIKSLKYDQKTEAFPILITNVKNVVVDPILSNSDNETVLLAILAENKAPMCSTEMLPRYNELTGRNSSLKTFSGLLTIVSRENEKIIRKINKNVGKRKRLTYSLADK